MTISLSYKMSRVKGKLVDIWRSNQFVFRKASPKSLVRLLELSASLQLKMVIMPPVQKICRP